MKDKTYIVCISDTMYYDEFPARYVHFHSLEEAKRFKRNEEEFYDDGNIEITIYEATVV